MRLTVQRFLTGTISFVVLLVAATASADLFEVTITNNAPTGGVALTPVWVGFHNGNFDTFNVGAPASASLESLAETGSVAGVNADFATAQPSGVQGALQTAPPPPIQPGQSVTQQFNLTAGGANNFFSFASMVIPSNDFFVGNDSATQHSIASLFGTGNSLTINVGTVYDAGTEAEDVDSSAGNPLFPTLPAGDGMSGLDTMNPIGAPTIPGYLTGPLDFSTYSNGIATITVTAVPEPGSVALLAFGLCGVLVRRRRPFVFESNRSM